MNVPLKQRAFSVASWSLVRTAADQILRFALFAYVARMLSPKDFGVFAVATIFIDYGRILATAGLSESLLQAKEVDEELLNTVFWSGLAGAAAVAGTLALLSVPLTGLVGVPEAWPFLAAMAGLMIMGPLMSVHGAMSAREFKNKRLALNGMICGVAGAVAAVASLHAGLGIWSLLVQQVVASLLNLALVWATFPWTPRLLFSTRRLRTVWGFSGQMLLARLIQVSIFRVQDLLTARFLGPIHLAQFRIGGRMFELMNNGLIAPVASSVLPILSRLQHDRPAFANAYRRMLAIACIASCPATFGFGVIAPDAIPLLFGERWLPAVPVVQVLALLAPATAQAYFAGPSLAAMGRPDVTVKFAVMQLTGTVVLAFIAVPFGITAVAGAHVARSYLTLPVQLRLFSKATDVPIRTVLGSILPPTCAAAIMVGAVLIARFFMDDLERWQRVGACIGVGAIAYPVALTVLFMPYVRDQTSGLREIAQSMRKK